MLPLKITCMCHQAKIATCGQTPLVAPIAPKNCTGGFFDMLNPNLPSDLLSDHSSNTNFKQGLLLHCHFRNFSKKFSKILKASRSDSCSNMPLANSIRVFEQSTLLSCIKLNRFDCTIWKSKFNSIIS